MQLRPTLLSPSPLIFFPTPLSRRKFRFSLPSWTDCCWSWTNTPPPPTPPSYQSCRASQHPTLTRAFPSAGSFAGSSPPNGHPQLLHHRSHRRHRAWRHHQPRHLHCHTRRLDGLPRTPPSIWSPTTWICARSCPSLPAMPLHHPRLPLLLLPRPCPLRHRRRQSRTPSHLPPRRRVLLTHLLPTPPSLPPPSHPTQNGDSPLHPSRRRLLANHHPPH
jgi:hypothetical protein